MTGTQILLAEDDDVSAELIKKIIDSSGYSIVRASNGKEALEIFEKEGDRFFAVIVDLQMPVMDGQELIDRLSENEHDPIIIVQTANSDLSTVISIMKKGVHDYILKPINKDELLAKIGNAQELSRLRGQKKVMKRESEIRLERQLAVNVWKESIMMRDLDRFDRNLFSNLKRSFSQGAGFGLILSVISIIEQEAVKKENSYEISSDLMEIISANAAIAGQALKVFEEIEFLVSTELEMKRMSLHEFHNWLSEFSEKMSDMAKIKNQSIKISDSRDGFSGIFLQINEEYLEKAIREIFINSFKFSKKDGTVYVLVNIHHGKLFVDFLNKPTLQKEGVIGIPPEYERIVIEPFFRLAHTVDESYNSLDFGLGLTMVNKIIQKHDGSISLSNVRDHFSQESGGDIRVNVSMTLPIER